MKRVVKEVKIEDNGVYYNFDEFDRFKEDCKLLNEMPQKLWQRYS